MEQTIQKPTTDFTSKVCFDCLKGYLAIMVLVHHTYQFSGLFRDTYFGMLLNLFGRYAVAGFMMITGYGLFASYKEKGSHYIKSFPIKRILNFYLNYLFFLLLYVFFYILREMNLTGIQMIKSLTFGGTIISFGWYLQVVLIMYIAFYLVFRFGKSETIRIILLAAFALGYLIVGYLLAYPDNMLTPVCSFLGGMLLSKYKEKIACILERFLFPVFIIFFVLLGITAYWVYMKDIKFPGVSITNPVMLLIAGIITDICFLVVLLSIVYFFAKKAPAVICNPFSRFVGKYSLDIYVCQGMVLASLSRVIGNKALFALLGMVLTVVAAIATKTIRTAWHRQ